jgi:hypothetical protein
VLVLIELDAVRPCNLDIPRRAAARARRHPVADCRDCRA